MPLQYKSYYPTNYMFNQTHSTHAQKKIISTLQSSITMITSILTFYRIFLSKIGEEPKY